MLHALDCPTKIILADGDVVVKKNLVRQNFAEADLGENKAKALAERYSSAFGLEASYLPDFIEDEKRLMELVTPENRLISRRYSAKKHAMVEKHRFDLVILIGATDNNKSRKMCCNVFEKARDLIYIDSGNGEHSGQIVCGIRRGGRTMFQPVSTFYPEILEDTDKFPTELSCAEASVSAPQSIAANIMAAAAVVNFVYNILVLGECTVRKVDFSTKTLHMRPTQQ